MNMAVPIDDLSLGFGEIILRQGELISDKLNILRLEHYPPDATKTLRQFSLAETAYFLGVTQSNVKKLHLEGKGPTPTTTVAATGPMPPNRCLSCGITSIDMDERTLRSMSPIADLRSHYRLFRS